MLELIQTEEHKECAICHKPLGYDSKSSGYLTCLDHRTCVKCGKHMNAKDVAWSLSEASLEGSTNVLVHPSCTILDKSQDPTRTIKESEWIRLNLIRNLDTPSPELSIDTNQKNAEIYQKQRLEQLTFEEKIIYLQMLEARVELVARSLAQLPQWKKDAVEEFEKSRQDKEARKRLEVVQKRTKETKEVDQAEIEKAAKETALYEFMKANELTDAKEAKKLFNERAKNIQFLVDAMHFTIEQATKQVDEPLRKQGRIK